MNPKTKRIDPAECEMLIERGHLVLLAISSEAHAARIEAQQAELEVALAEARRGDAHMLQSWLTGYHGTGETLQGTSESSSIAFKPRTPSRDASPREEPDVTTCFVPSSLPVVSSPIEHPLDPTMTWDYLLPAARARLETQAKSLEAGKRNEIHSPLTESSTETVANEIVLEHASELEITNESVGDEMPVELPVELPDEMPVESYVESYAELPSDDPLVYEELPELQVLAEAQRDLGKPFFRSGTRGLLVSVVVHLVLISTLMAITMRIPEQPASLGFEAGSSDSLVESFDNLQPMEVTAPDVVTPEMPSEAVESAPGLPSAVGLSSASVSAASPAVASNMSGVQASANRAVSGAHGRPNPANANASFFGAGASGSCFCYVIDGSESMRGGPWEAAKAELLRSLATMKESHRFYIIFFNQKLSAITLPGEREPATSPLYATAANLKHAQNWIDSLRIERGAPPNDALLHAIELEPDAIYLLADGATKIDVPGFLRTKNRTSDFISGEQVRVPIHAIAFYSPEAGQKLMKRVAMENKGQFIYVPDPRRK